MPDDAPVAVEEFLREQLSDENVEPGADDLLGTPLDEPAVEEPGDEEDTTEASTDTAAIPEPEAEEEQAAEEESTEDTDEVEIKVKGKETSLDALLPKTVHTVKVDGEEMEVNYQELISGYQRGQDYSNKTAELKREREDLLPYAQLVAYAKKDPQFTQYISSYFQNGPFPEAANNEDLKVSDDELVAMMDPDSKTYNSEKAAKIFRARKEWQEKARQRQAIDQQANQEFQAQKEAWMADQVRQTINVVDEQFGEGSYEENHDAVRDYLDERGVLANPQAYEALQMAPIAALAYEAYFHSISQGSKAPKARIGRKRKKLSPPKSARAGQGKQSGTKQNKRVRDSYRNAVKTQKDDDWVTAIESRLNFNS